MTFVVMAMDRALSARRTDAQGFLHLETSNISKANVCPYYGREIPNWQGLGLDGDRIYNLLRDPVELAAAAGTFNNLPILSEHVPVDADSIPDDLVVGSTGSHGAFDGKYLSNTLVVWKRGAIDGIESRRKMQLSSAYRYTAVMTPGNFEGVHYDGKMTNLAGNHVALVIEGRAGPDVVVGDERMKTRTALRLSGAVSALVAPLLAQDAKVDLAGAFADVSADNLGDGSALAEAVVAVVTPQLAADKALTVDEVKATIALVPVVAQDDALTVAPTSKPAVPPVVEPAPVTAMDEAAVQQRIDAAVTGATDRATAVRAAERDVFPVIGEVVAMDSADAVYKTALDHLGVDLTGVDKASYGAVFRIAKNAQMAKDSNPTPLAADASADADFRKRFPNAKPLVRS